MLDCALREMYRLRSRRERIRGFGFELDTAGRQQSKRFGGAGRGDKTTRSEKAARVSEFEVLVMVQASVYSLSGQRRKLLKLTSIDAPVTLSLLR